MAVEQQEITDKYAIYLSDAMEVMRSLPDGCIHLSLSSPPFGGLWEYSSSNQDLSNCADYEEFLQQYEYVIGETHRLTMPGRMTAIHCMDVPTGNSGKGEGLIDFPGDIIRLHAKCGFQYVARYSVWKEPLSVRLRTLAKGLMHITICEDSSQCSVAGADYLLVFRKRGENPVPIEHPRGLMSYAGSREIPREVLGYRGWSGDQTRNRYSHWIWRQYASAFWDDIRVDRVLPYRNAKGVETEPHPHPLQLDVIDRILTLWSNPGETVLTPFMGVGSEVYGAVLNGRRGIGVELKESYYVQALNNLRAAAKSSASVDPAGQGDLLEGIG